MFLRLALLALVIGLQAGCSTVMPGASYPRTVSTAFDRHDASPIARRLAAAPQVHAEPSGFRLLSVGVDGFLTRVQMADAAGYTLDLQYFILRNDETGGVLTDAILRAADRGVRVRILVDDGETDDGDERIQILDAHPGIEVRVFNPFFYRGHVKLVRATEFALRASRLDYRMHNKVFVTDNAAALVGGRNIADEYFQVDPDRQFADDDVFAVGPVVREVSRHFDAFWNSDAAVPVAALRGKPTPSELAAFREELAGRRQRPLPDGFDYAGRIASGEPLRGMLAGTLPLSWARAMVVCDSPDKKAVEAGWRVGSLMERPVAEATSAVRSELLMITPYLVPGNDGMKLLTDLTGRDVEVRLLTNSLESNTVPAAQAGYMRYRKRLLDHGMDLYEVRARLGNVQGSGQTAAISRYGNYSLHGKMIVFDRRRVFVGSMNFDQRSMHLNTEIGLIIDSEAIAQEIATRFGKMVSPENAYRIAVDASSPPALTWTTVEEGVERRLSVEPAKSAWQRLQVGALLLLPLDREL